MASSLLSWDEADRSLFPSAHTIQPIKDLSVLQQSHIDPSLPTLPTPDVPSIVIKPPVFPCTKLEGTVGSALCILNGLLLTRPDDL